MSVICRDEWSVQCAAAAAAAVALVCDSQWRNYRNSGPPGQISNSGPPSPFFSTLSPLFAPSFLPSLSFPIPPSLFPSLPFLSLPIPNSFLPIPSVPSPLYRLGNLGSAIAPPAGPGCGRQTHFCAIHSPKSANMSKVSPTCSRRIYTRGVLQ